MSIGVVVSQRAWGLIPTPVAFYVGRRAACLAADGKLAPSAPWVQESIVGSRFEASYQPLGDGTIRPTITARAHITLVGQLVIQADDPYGWGF